MEILIKAGQFFLSLSILVILHELGHFLFAKLFKTRVEKFYLFFNPWFSLFKIKRGETEYGVGWLPLGGYVKISGMIDESMDKEQLKQPPQPYEFRSKPAWQRLLIMIGGVLVNVILALFIYSAVLYTWGEDYLPTKSLKYGVSCDSLATELGFRNGDKILYVGGKEIENFQQIAHDILLNENRDVTVLRGTDTLNIKIAEDYVAKLVKSPIIFFPRIPFVVDDVKSGEPAEKAGFIKGDRLLALNGQSAQFFDEFKSEMQRSKGKTVRVTVERNGNPIDLNVDVPETGIIGVYPVADLGKFFELSHREYSFFHSIPAGVKKGFATISSYLKQLKLIFSPKTKAYESVGGFITIGKIFPSTWDWQAFWSLTAFLSIILAIMNILPIPALDGGHVMFLLYEIITGRKPGDKFLEYAQLVGMAILLALLLYANINDIVKLFR
ncbi:MAG: RIP metalloprotease RseP [Tenuifilum sp.]|uniref:RIP metalloprotease RseP n=1 Tax=Tenuifilum sp. TaxID=2760880 RepID=UPI001B4402B3|nr:RIP metalloprotease RseP [Bacteroidales bacterium]HOK60444.1 RIP metalloprotease RseP [Tenuifilum sp.]MBP9029907.1 RIP metalloprotease RseP [Bacteroidales bacterium]HOK85888.1 RIP metalloprotease RseP [Tenuifilum sp.]HON70749.1 RIP metalloprotease RseP [Tenuifilum sp.]